MSLKFYTVFNFLFFILILLIFSILSSVLICIVQYNFQYLILYLFRMISHIFEPYNLFCISCFFITYILISYYLKNSRNIFFVVLLGSVLGIIVYQYDLRAIFIYKSLPLDNSFYIYFISYVITLICGYKLLKQLWKNIDYEK